jgi:hypothetical protein
VYPQLKFYHIFLHFIARLWSILGSNFTKFSRILQPDSGVSLAQIPPSFLAFYSQTVEYPWLEFTIFSCILHTDSGVSLAQIPPSFLAFYSQTLDYPWLEFHQVFLYFTARLWSILGPNLTKFSCILQPDSGVSSARQSIQSIDTPRGSWASFDLRNSVSDLLIPSLLERVAPETIDQLNEVRRQEERQVCLL